MGVIQPETKNLWIGYFGASAGAAAALIAAVRMNNKVHAVVSRSGSMNLADRFLERVKCPTLLIVGATDLVGLELNRDAFRRLACEKRLDEIPDASSLFGEPGKLEEMAETGARWFIEHLPNRKPPH